MSDIFHEVEEEVRREKFQKIWKEYGDYIIATVAAVIIAVSGWQLWNYYQDNKKAEAAAAYTAAHNAAAQNDVKGALTQFDKVIQSSPPGYTELAELSKANTLAAANKPAEAIAAYKAFAEKYKDVFGDAARVRAGFLMADTAAMKDLVAMLKPVADKKDGFGPQAREIIAYGYYHAGDLKQAQAGFDAIFNDPASPQNLRQRAGAMATFIKSGGSASTGTVPPVAEPKADATPAAVTP